MKFFKNKNFFILIILILSIVLRFYNYGERWGIAKDQAYDVIIARYALENFKIPFLGPWSSAGPFQMPPTWNLFIMLGVLSYPYSLISPWIFQTLIYVFFVFLIIKFGTELLDEKFGLILGALAAVSTAQIDQGINLTNQSPLAITSLVSLWFSIKYIRQKEVKFLFLSSLFIGISSSFHLQGVSLLFLLIFSIILGGFPGFKGLILSVFGFLIPWIPLFLYDLRNNLFTTKNMIYYYFHDQYRISYEALGRRWTTYLIKNWIDWWAHIIGAKREITIINGIILFLISLISLIKRKISKEIALIILSFLGGVFVVRYARTPVFDSYVVFSHPFVLILSAWVIYNLIKFQKILGFIFFAVVLFASFQKDVITIVNSQNYTALVSNQWIKQISEKYPNKKFAVYDFRYATTQRSIPLSLFLYEDNKIDDNGIRIGVVIATSGAHFESHPILVGNGPGWQILNLESSSSAQLEKEGWSFVNPSLIFNKSQYWYENEKH